MERQVEHATALKTADLEPRIGSELKVDKETLLHGDVAGEIRELLVQRGVLIARGLHLTADEQRALARRLGELRLGTVKKEGDEGLLKVTFDKKVNPEYAQFFFGTLLWHMDGTYEEIPPFATLLTPHTLSETGGQTEFTNTYAAYEDLTDDDKALVDKLTVVHTMQAALFPGKPDCSPEEFALWCTYPNREHPLVWQHKSGRKSLVLSTSASHIVGMHPAESRDLLQRLMFHAAQPQYVYRHTWQMGDLLIWDNTGTMHRVLPFPEDSGRQLHRFTLNGEEPIRAVG
jgi:alpha-ketoglutarate-dependent taurine dioxygenase